MLVRLQGETLQITECLEVKDHIKALGGKWDAKNKAWKIGQEAILDIMKIGKGAGVRITRQVEDLLHSEAAKQRHLEQLKTGAIKPAPHAFLYEHQMKCVEIAKMFKKFAFLLDTGVGKTLASLEIIAQDLERKWLIITPKPIIKTAWIEDATKFYPWLKVLPLSKNMKKVDYQELCHKWKVTYTRRDTTEDLLIKLQAVAQVYIINPESFKLKQQEIEALGVNGLILDESTTIKNPTSQISKAVTDTAKKLERVYILTGKPAPNGLLDYYAQLNLVAPQALGDSFYRFKMRYFVAGGFGGYELYPKDGAETEIAERIKPYSLIISKKDCLDLPDKTYMTRLVELDSKTAKLYKEFQKEMYMELAGQEITATNAASKIMKLRQLTSGFIYDADGTAQQVHSHKINELSNVLDELGAEQAIIWIQFKEEVKAISAMLDKRKATYTTAYSGSKNIDQNIKDFKTGAAQYIICHPGSVKFGVTFVNCTYAIYYSQSYNFEDYYQSHDRIYRLGQTNKCTYIFIECENTIDQTIHKAVENKQKISAIVEDLLKGGAEVAY